MVAKSQPKRQLRPAQSQRRQPGIEAKMRPLPESIKSEYHSGYKLAGKAAIITGGDSGIGRAVAQAFAKEGADVAIVYLDEHVDAKETAHFVEEMGRRCLLFDGDIGDESFCQRAVKATVKKFGRLDIVVNNAAAYVVGRFAE